MRVDVLKREADTAVVQITPGFWGWLFGESTYCISVVKHRMTLRGENWWYASVSLRPMSKAVVDALDREEVSTLPRAKVLR